MNFGIFLFFLWSLSIFLSFRKSTDVFSISKTYGLVFFTFFGEIFWKAENYSSNVQIICTVLIVINFFIVLFERKLNGINWSLSFKKNDRNKLLILIWILSTIPVYAQIYLTLQFGGFASYLSSIGGRVIEWRGLGIYIFLTKLINILNYFYFIVFIKDIKKSKIHYILFFGHFVIFLGIALMAGSRSNVLWNLVFMLVFFNYNVRKISVKKAGFGFVGVLLLAMLLGVAREGYEYTNNGFHTGLKESEKLLEASNFKYGLEPLEKLYEYESIDEPQLGLTFVTAITNLIPRAMWPEKPDSGGVIITNKYFKDPYNGYSNYTTGIISEGIINFGFITGPILGILILSILIRLVVRFQKKINKIPYRFVKTNTNINGSIGEFILYQGIYGFIIFGITSYIYAEFTTNSISLFVFKIFLFLILFYFFRRTLVKSFRLN